MHKNEEDINIVENPCGKCGLNYFLNSSSGLCNICNEYFIKKRIHKKEKLVGDFLISKGYIFESSDKIIHGSCSKFRPDYVCEIAGILKLIIEVDENQHKQYEKDCEINRMKQIHQDFDGFTVIFVRYNPDNYRRLDEEGRPIGIPIKQNINRLEVLLQTIKFIEKFTNDGGLLPPLTACHLFYDGFESPKIEEIKIFN